MDSRNFSWVEENGGPKGLGPFHFHPFHSGLRLSILGIFCVDNSIALDIFSFPPYEASTSSAMVINFWDYMNIFD